jgi:integral membrane sensor domain MASE1
MAEGGGSHRLGESAVAAALVAGYAASVLFSFLMSRVGGPTASIWTANGFLAAALILLRGRWRTTAVAICLVFQAGTALAIGDGPVRSLLQPPLNLLEAGLAAWLAVRFAGARTRRLSLRKLSLLLIGAIVPAAMVAAVFGAILNRVLWGQDLLDGWLNWAISGGFGMAMVLPTLLLVAREAQYKEFHRSPLETSSLIAGVAGLTGAVFFQSGLPLQFAIFPALTLIAFRLGPPGAAVAALVVGMISLPLVMLGHGPGMLSRSLDAVSRVRLSEAVVVCALFVTLATAGAIADQSRLRRLVLDRDRAIRAARARARQAEQLLNRPRRAGARKDVADAA